MFSELDLILREKKGCGIVLLEEPEKIKSIETYIEENLGNRYFLVINADDIGVLGIDEFFEKLLKEFGVSSLEEFAQKLEKEGRELFVLIKDIDKLSFEQLKGFESLCKKAKGKFSLLLIGSEKIKDLIDSFYLKNLRKSAEVLIGCGNLKKEEIKGFAEKYLKEILGKEVKLDKDIDNYLYKISEGNEKKLERVLKKVSENIKENTLTKEHLRDFLIEKEEVHTEKLKEEKTEKIDTEISKSIPSKPIAIVAAVIFFLGGLALFFLGNEENPKEEQVSIKKEQNQENKEYKILKKQESFQEDNQQIVSEQKSEELNQIKQEKKVTVDNDTPDYYFPLRRVIYLREKPDKKSKIVARVRIKTLLEMVERQDNWLKLKYKIGSKEIEGWTERKNVVKVPPGKAVIIAKALNLREHPSLQSKVLTSIPYGNVVDVLDELTVENRKWYKVMYIDRKGDIYEGWVSSRFVIYNKGEKKDSP